MRLVLDTNIVVSGLLWSGAPRLLIDAAQERKIMLFTSAPLLRELANVLGRGKFDKKVAAFQLTPEQVVQRYIELAFPVVPNPVPRIVIDAGDDVVLGTAKATRADYIVSGDDHLLRLGSFEGILIFRAATAVEYMRLER